MYAAVRRTVSFPGQPTLLSPSLIASLKLPPLPIDAVVSQVHAALAASGTAVVVAPPGAGKTTRLPIALLDAPWRGDGKILVLEPRRLAARAAAQQMSRLLGEEVGQRIGYRVRLDQRVSARTRVEVVTEGILTRMLQDDPALDGVAAVLFDEFHERHLPGDLGLALALESRALVRPDLRLLVMSATLEAAPVAALLGAGAVGGATAPVIVSEGRAHPVETAWRPVRDGVPFARGVANAVRTAFGEADGDVLVFLPGVGELHRVRDALSEDLAPGSADVLLLHGSLSLDEQDRVLRRSGVARRIILSTAIAESSVTLEGVRSVVDVGLARVPRYSPQSGMTRLETVRVSRAAADQRRGRAGREAPGRCIRLWDEAVESSLAARAVPEILDADLTALALELACAGVRDAAALRWLDAPPVGALAQARELLIALEAIDREGRVSAHGRAMAALGIEPRLAHAVLRGQALGHAALTCDVAALLSERDILRRDAAEHDQDLATRWLALHDRAARDGVDRQRLERVRAEARALRQAIRAADDSAKADEGAIGEIVALAFPDRIARRRAGSDGRYLMRNGRGAKLPSDESPLARAEFLAIADVDGNPAESRIWLASPIDEAALRVAAASAITTVRHVAFDAATDAVTAVERETLGAIVLTERAIRDVSSEEIAAALLDTVRARGVAALPWTVGDLALRARLEFAHRAMPETFPDQSDAALAATLEAWLAPAIQGVRRWRDLANRGLGDAMLAALPWQLRGRLDAIAPTHVEVPSRSRIPIDYSVDPPVLAVRLQEMFGLTETPRVGDGRVALAVHLLSPAGRPVQVTRDLASFWRTTYFDVKKDLKGRYPRHHWPDDPLVAPPTRRVKPRGS
jgi:ATP-dependent helicase HrpB